MFNDRLRATRISCGVTQQKTADALNVQLRHYQKYESGDIEPDLTCLLIFCWKGMIICNLSEYSLMYP